MWPGCYLYLGIYHWDNLDIKLFWEEERERSWETRKEIKVRLENNSKPYFHRRTMRANQLGRKTRTW
ncbi:hypothetical protein HN832_02800 [archaeon]|jgi:hypothetical protein|nr:hypothetical protein [archaeon]MBT4373284.1 hypothetical protein [archaeon]MBT4531629.1 hypothetical protein [archaeon]MBT7001193.1 hypothetical protein [archaeon]MBT7282321.1 hypothetical protein [archaeon]